MLWNSLSIFFFYFFSFKVQLITFSLKRGDLKLVQFFFENVVVKKKRHFIDHPFRIEPPYLPWNGFHAKYEPNQSIIDLNPAGLHGIVVYK